LSSIFEVNFFEQLRLWADHSSFVFLKSLTDFRSQDWDLFSWQDEPWRTTAASMLDLARNAVWQLAINEVRLMRSYISARYLYPPSWLGIQTTKLRHECLIAGSW